MSELKKFDEPIGLQRLRKLQILIETNMWFNKDVKFSMGSWKDDPVTVSMKGKVIYECGTTACLCGMYTMAYPEDKLQLVRVSENENETLSLYNLVFDQDNGYRAAANFFELDFSDVQWLFSPETYNEIADDSTKIEALERVKEAIKGKVACLS